MNRMQVVCDNTECDDLGKVKELMPLHLGQGIYQRPDLVCRCGYPARDTQAGEVEYQTPPELLEYLEQNIPNQSAWGGENGSVNLPAQTRPDEGRPGADNVNLTATQLPLWENTDEVMINERLYRRVRANPGGLY